MPLWACHFGKCFQLTVTATPTALASRDPKEASEMLLLSQGSLFSQRDVCDTRTALTVSPITDDINSTWYVLYTERYLKPQGSLKRERKIKQVFTIWDSWVSSRATASCPSRLNAATSFFKGELLLSLEGGGFPGSKLKIWTDQELTCCKEWIDEGIRNTLKRIIIHEVAIHITIF